MKKFRLPGLAIGLALLSVFVIFSCQKEKDLDKTKIPEGQQRVSIRLSDNPVSFDAVNVDIQRVEVLVIPDSCNPGRNDNDNDWGRCDYDRDGDHHDFGRCAVWDTLDIRAGIYNLLDLSNGVDTLLANGFTIAGQIKRIRLTLGTSNSVVVDSVSYPLTLWNGNNRVTIGLRGEDVDEITPGDLQLWLDFDAGRSIVRVSNNHFVLKPHLRIWLPAQTAGLKGKVLPLRAHAVVSAISNGDTLIAIPDHHDGKFKIRGLRGTTADIFINATANGYQDTTILGVPLQRGRDADIGTIQLRN
jgi:hypothetical protein